MDDPRVARLAVDDVTVAFDDRVVLDSVSLTVDGGEVVALRGPSGSGKTTLLRVIAGLLVPRTGRIVVDGVDVSAAPTHRRRIGMVFQDNQLFPHRNVGANVAFGLRMAGLPRHARDDRVRELLALVGLTGFERRDVASLSGGEAKRVALARSLAPAPAVLLLDEPLTGLDRELHDQLAGELTELLHDGRTATVLVTHDQREAETIADRVVMLAGEPD